MNAFIGNLENSKTNPAPRIEPYLPPADRRTGAAVVIFPGGGYGGLAPHEGKGYAEFLCAEGIACFVAAYRVGPQGCRHPAMLEDALSAVAAVRSRARELGIDPARIGVMGSSAGGHLAAHAMTAYDACKSSVSLRPDFGILCYPVITMESDFTHMGSRINLLGKDSSEELARSVSCQNLVSPRTPPCFLWHTWEDPGVPVENTLMFAAAMRKNGVPFEMHIYPKGGHGLGLNTDLPWGRDCIRWLKELAGEA